jgi:putative phosphoesterase
MRLALLSDLHSNVYALDAVLKECEEFDVNRFVIAGDFLGYYFHGEDVICRIQTLESYCVKGNHDEFFLDNYLKPKYSRVDQVNVGLQASEKSFELLNLSADSIAFLSALQHPLEFGIEGRNILLAHGHPVDMDMYIYPGNISKLTSLSPDIDIVILGHTHWPMLHHVNGVTVINPGSVGQPRDGKPGASWAILDLDDLSVQFKRTNYDVGPLLEDCKIYDPDNLLLTKYFT